MAATYTFSVDWDGDGDFAGTGEDVTARVLDQRQQLTISYGRDTHRAGSPISGGQAAVMIDNRSRDYSPENDSSPLAGMVLPGREVRIQADADGTDTVLFRGHLDDMAFRPGLNDRSVPVTCLDGLARLKGLRVSTALHRGVRTGEAIGAILDAAGWTAGRDLDPGATVMPFWWLSAEDAFDAVLELVDSEGAPALVTIGPDGEFVFRDRHHRLALTTAQATWRSSGAEPLIGEPTTYNHGWREIVNAYAVQVPVRQLSSGLRTAWATEGRLSIADGETVTLTAVASSAMAGALTPVSGVDYTATSGSVSVALSRTSGQSIDVLVTAVGGPAVIDRLQLRARIVETSATVQVSVEDPASIETYGRRGPQEGRTPAWVSPYDAQAIGEILVGRRAQRLPTLSVSMVGAGDPARLEQILTRDLSDRVRVVEEHTGLDADCFVERIEHTIGQGGLEHRTVFGVERAPTEVANPFRFDVAGAGFDDGQFQAMGAISSTEVFRFDVVGQGFDDGCFGY